ncbi:MAG: hypothetical protein RBS19_03290 [Bacteroidales bacterium]|nr:hypothetical protein [Bacteroidales bacterium]MDY0215962.1 hypothetical protein [Bacteroidales bacterium]
MNGIKLDDNNQVVVSVKKDSSGIITSGMVVDNINAQRCRIIAEMFPGELKEHPVLGFGISKYLKKVDIDKQQFINELTKQYKADGMNTKVTIGNNKFEVDIL